MKTETFEGIHRLYEDASLGCIIYDHNYVIQYCNTKAIEIGEKLYCQILEPGKSMLTYIRSKEQESFKLLSEKVFLGESENFSGTVHNKEKKELLFSFDLLPFYEGQQVSGVMFLVVDVTYFIEQQKTDSLTGVFNRHILQEVLTQHIAQEIPFTLLNVDLDNFRTINRLKGYDFGDSLLQDLISRIQENFPGEMVVRSHSDSFFILCQHPDTQDRIDVFFGKEYFSFQGITYAVSAGISRYPEHGDNMRDIVFHSETALRDAKKKYANSYEYFQPSAVFDQEMQSYIMSAMADALEEEHFYLEYQPVVNTLNGTYEGFEALLRWKDPLKGQISPGLFIPIAESNGLIKKMTRFVFQKVVEDYTRHFDMLKDKYISINVSILDLMGPELTKAVEQGVAAFPEIRGRIELEVTESYYIENYDFLRARIQYLQSLGVRIAIDDFGTGYSSLDRLIGLKLDRIKLDRSFINQVMEYSGEVVILQSLISVAKIMNLNLTVQGIESKKQAELLKIAGVFSLQGYYFSQPKELEALLYNDSLCE